MDRRSFIKSLALAAASAAITKAVPVLWHTPLAKAADDGPWIPCDGRSLKINDYPELFKALENAYGPGDLPNTFRIPYVHRLENWRIVDEVHEGGEVMHAQYEIVEVILARPDQEFPVGYMRYLVVPMEKAA